MNTLTNNKLLIFNKDSNITEINNLTTAIPSSSFQRFTANNGIYDVVASNIYGNLYFVLSLESINDFY